VRQGDSERNFHVFYYLFAGMSADRKANLSLTEPTNYHYLRGGYKGLTRDALIDMGTFLFEVSNRRL
jgi:myosin heavy subunit